MMILSAKQYNKLVAYVDRIFTWDERKVYKGKNNWKDSCFKREEDDTRILISITKMHAFIHIGDDMTSFRLENFATVREFKNLIKELA